MKYEYVNISVDNFFGAGSLEHRQVIDEYALLGFRYVGYIPTKMNDYGKIKEIDLIFEVPETKRSR